SGLNERLVEEDDYPSPELRGQPDELARPPCEGGGRQRELPREIGSDAQGLGGDERPLPWRRRQLPRRRPLRRRGD
ncbi:MAG TPA: hypothetical protein VKD72_09580, partial [Gemmataceae bacterium]|nr:hypothetical protein [Gemmataceae bacterium]